MTLMQTTTTVTREEITSSRTIKPELLDLEPEIYVRERGIARLVVVVD